MLRQKKVFPKNFEIKLWIVHHWKAYKILHRTSGSIFLTFRTFFCDKLVQTCLNTQNLTHATLHCDINRKFYFFIQKKTHSLVDKLKMCRMHAFFLHAKRKTTAKKTKTQNALQLRKQLIIFQWLGWNNPVCRYTRLCHSPIGHHTFILLRFPSILHSHVAITTPHHTA